MRSTLLSDQIKRVLIGSSFGVKHPRKHSKHLQTIELITYKNKFKNLHSEGHFSFDMHTRGVWKTRYIWSLLCVPLTVVFMRDLARRLMNERGGGFICVPQTGQLEPSRTYIDPLIAKRYYNSL